MNYETLAVSPKPFDNLSADEATRLFVYMTKIRKPTINADEIYRRYGFVPEGGSLSMFRSLDLTVEIAEEISQNPSLGVASVGCWIDRYLCKGIRVIDDHERDSLMQDLDRDAHFSFMYDSYEFIAVECAGEMWLKADEETLSSLSAGEMFVLEKWSMFFQRLHGKCYEVMISSDDCGIYGVSWSEVRAIPEECSLVPPSSMYGILFALCEASERELPDSAFDEIEEYRERCLYFEED